MIPKETTFQNTNSPCKNTHIKSDFRALTVPEENIPRNPLCRTVLVLEEIFLKIHVSKF